MLEQVKNTRTGEQKLPSGGESSIPNSGDEKLSEDPVISTGHDATIMESTLYDGNPHIICSNTGKPCFDCGMNGCGD